MLSLYNVLQIELIMVKITEKLFDLYNNNKTFLLWPNLNFSDMVYITFKDAHKRMLHAIFKRYGPGIVASEKRNLNAV
jgi:hypothetical protein